jgi:ubiquinone/menaquinone biosynthesis C-methylase UbiE
MVDKTIPESGATQLVREDWYRQYYETKGADRNSLLGNPEVLFQLLAQDAAFVRALRAIRPDPRSTRVLDVGCGEGASLCSFLRLGFLPQNLYGVDFQAERIEAASRQFPKLNFLHGDATSLPFPGGHFDVVTETTVFIHSVDDALSQQIADEMIRVTRAGGHIVLCDWRYAKPGSSAHKALTRARIEQLFSTGRHTAECGTFSGPLVPPVGRFFSAHCPSLYFLIQAWFQFLVGQKTTVLRKTAN